MLLLQQADRFPDIVPDSHWAVDMRSVSAKGTSIGLGTGNGELHVFSVSVGKKGPNLLADGVEIPLLDSVIWDGRKLPVKWVLDRTTSDPKSPRIRFWYKCDSPRLEMDSLWVGSDSGGPIEHTLTIRNLTGDAVPFAPPESLAVSVLRPKGHDVSLWWIEKGAGGPTEPGVHVVPLQPGVLARVRSTGYSSDHPKDGVPWATVYDATAKRGLYFGIESSSRTRLAFDTTADGVTVRAGSDADDPDGRPATVRLGAGEAYVAPPVFVGAFSGDVDDGGNELRHWVASTLRPKSTTPLPLATLNTWGNGMSIDALRSREMADVAQKLGMELFHIDAGWFRGVGDWRPDPQKFPNGIRPVSDYVHALGMKFGLWLAWTQAGVGDDTGASDLVLNALNRKDWLATPQPPGWKPDEFIGTDLCMSVPDAQKWCTELLTKLVRDYGIDMLEHDQRMVVQQCDQSSVRSLWGHDHPHTASPLDISRKAADGYYFVQDAVRREFPNLLFEDCVNGGRMVDYGVIRRAHYISISDAYGPLANRQAFYDASFVLPPSMCECYVQAMPTKNDAEFLTMLRSGMMGWFSLMQDPTKWTESQIRLAATEIGRYKAVLRPFISEGDLYHLTARPKEGRYDAVEYALHDGQLAVAYVFRNSASSSSMNLKWRALRPDANYTYTYSGHSMALATGRQMMAEGVQIQIDDPGGSDIVFARIMP